MGAIYSLLLRSAQTRADVVDRAVGGDTTNGSLRSTTTVGLYDAQLLKQGFNNNNTPREKPPVSRISPQKHASERPLQPERVPVPELPSALTSALSSEDASAWASVSWNPVTNSDGIITGWHKTSVPYVPGGVSLQTLDVWIPASSSSSSPSVPEPSALPSRPGPSGRWLVFIHGGAWRDPRVSADSFAPTATRLLGRAAALPLTGLVSLNYRLSPHPDFPSADDPGRQAHHPDHVVDVLSGLAFMQRIVAALDPASDSAASWILAGHSCGATLAFQALMDPARWRQQQRPDNSQLSSHAPAPVPAIQQPRVVVGLNGLYDLAGFIDAPPASHASLRDGYEEFTRGAFGDDEAEWRAACPATAPGWLSEWKPEPDPELDATQRGKREKGRETRRRRRRIAVLVQSREDTLVPYAQLEGMRAYLQRAAASEQEKAGHELEVVEMQAGGDHNELWQKGDRMAEILADVIAAL